MSELLHGPHDGRDALNAILTAIETAGRVGIEVREIDVLFHGVNLFDESLMPTCGVENFDGLPIVADQSSVSIEGLFQEVHTVTDVLGWGVDFVSNARGKLPHRF